MRKVGKNYVLAMYDIRGKQEYIYRTNKLKEIIGASAVIRDCFKDFLYGAAKEYRNLKNNSSDNDAEAIINYKSEKEKVFDRNLFEKRMAEGKVIGEVVYDGGGNFWVLYKDKDSCVETNKLFTKKVVQNTYSLKVLCTFTEGVNFDDFKGDRKKLYEKHRIREATQTPSIPAQVLPFTRVDYSTSLPLYKEQVVNRNPEKKIPVSKESYYKYKKYWEIADSRPKEFGELVLDKLVTQKGEESLLAVVYIDGNNMGDKVSECLKGKSYEECINELRKFSDSIQKDYVDDRIKNIDNFLSEKYAGDDIKRRFVIYAGDEINFICNARDAYDLAIVYLNNLPQGCSACAGISVFHSHAPYSEVYRIAEECCESGKKKMKKLGLDNVCLIDVHYCQGGIGTDLETIREAETEGRVSRPWFVTAPKNSTEKYITCDVLNAMANVLKGIARSNVKGLAVPAKKSMADFKMELRRIEAHLPAGKPKPDWNLNNTLSDDEVRKIIYDMAIFYDIWFSNIGG